MTKDESGLTLISSSEGITYHEIKTCQCGILYITEKDQCPHCSFLERIFPMLNEYEMRKEKLPPCKKCLFEEVKYALKKQKERETCDEHKNP